MEEQENLTPSQMLALIQGLLVNNSRAIENLESAVTELDLSRDKSKDDLNSHYARVCTMLNEVYKTSIEEVATQHDKKKGDLKRKKKQLTRSSLALVPELANLRSGATDADDAVSRCKQILAKLTEDVGLEKIDGRVSFNFIPKLRKLKLGFLQLCNNLPEDFALRLLTPIMNIRLGQQIRCGIEGNFTAENVRHLEFGIRRDNDFVPSRNLGTEGKVFNFGFTADLGGVYVILACLFGNPIAHSPLTLTIHESGPRITNDDVLASHIEVSSDAIGLKASEEEDADKISSSVQDAGSVKASTKAVKGNEEKSSSMALEKPKPYQQIKDDPNTDFNRNRKESMIDGQDGQVRINNNDLPGGRFKIGESCVALGQDGIWYNGLIEASNSDGSFHIKFIDYGNSDNVALAGIVKSAPDIPDAVPDYDVDDHVGSRAAEKVLKDTTLGKNGKENSVQDLKTSNKNVDTSLSTKEAEKIHYLNSENKAFEVGDACVAQWSEDQVWYNGIVQSISEDGSYSVTFTDFGNTDYINHPFIVKETSAIPPGESVDENVNNTSVVSKSNDTKENNEMLEQSPPTDENVNENNEMLEQSPPTDENVNGALSKKRRNKCKPPAPRPLKSKSKPPEPKSLESKSKPFNILQHVTKSKDGGQELFVKCILKISENLHSPIGITVLRNKSIVIGSIVDISAKIFRPDGTNWAPISSVRHFVKATDMTTLSTGEFVVRDDFGLQLFTEQGEYIKSLATKQIDECFGLAQDEDGNIIVINWVQPSRSSKPGSKGKGGLTDVGETDVFFISRKSGEVLKRIELTDIISDKTKSKCRFLSYHKNTLYIVDNGLQCIYKLKTDGNEVSVIKKPGTKKFWGPSGIVVDDFGNFIVVDSKYHRLQVFDQEENFVGFVAVEDFRRPSGIFLDKELGELYVLNYWGNYPMVKYSPTPITMSTTSLQKHRNFVAEPMNDKPVTDLVGIGAKLGKCLDSKGFDKAYVVLGQFLLLKKNQELFEEWIKDLAGANKRQAADCYQCLADWCDEFL